MKTPNPIKIMALTLTAAAAALIAVAWLGCGVTDNGNGEGKRFAVFNGKNVRTITTPETDEKKGDTTWHTLSITTHPANGGTVTRVPDQQKYAAGTQATVCATPDSGHGFTGWTGALTSNNPCEIITMNGNKTLVANFQQKPPTERPELTTAVYPESGGSITRNPNQTSYNMRTPVIVCATPAEGYSFTGWTGSLRSEKPCTTITMDGDKTLIAEFTPTLPTFHILKIDRGPTADAGAVTPASGESYKANTPVQIKATPASCYTFDKWTVDSGTATFANADSAATTVTLNSNATISAGFKQKNYKLTINTTPEGGGNVARSPTLDSYACGTTVGVTAMPATYYEFSHWTGALTSKNINDSLAMNGDRELTAHFKRIQYRLTISPPAGGTATGGGTFDAGTPTPITAAPDSKYRFHKWTATSGTVTFADASNPSTTVTLHSDATVSAGFQPDTVPLCMLTIDITPPAGGTVSRSPEAASYPCGTQVTITATPRGEEYAFTVWSGAASSANATVTVTVNSDTKLTANFQELKYTLTTIPNPTAGGTATASGTFKAGTDAPITATAKPGYRFNGWTPTDGIANPNHENTTVAMTRNRTVTANFVQMCTLTVNRNPAAGGNVTGSGTFDAGTNATITATANSGYRFDGWTPIMGVTAPNSANTTVSMTQSRTVTANFVQMCTLTVNRSPAAGGNVTGGGAFDCGTNAPITATANQGYRFDGWTPTTGVTAPNSANTTVSMSQSRTVTANFKKTYTLTSTPNPTAGGTVSPAGTTTHDSGATVTITAARATFYRFDGWTPTAGIAQPNDTSITVAMTQNRTVTANFKGGTGITDPRDGKNYRTEKIGKETWMAENLNYTTANSWCYDNNTSNCAKYGRMYTWDAAMSACPAGWYLPTNQEWGDLVQTAGGSSVAGGKLKSKTGWNSGGNGTDAFGFSALPGGLRYINGSFDFVGIHGYWWSATEFGSTSAYRRSMNYVDETVYEVNNDKGDGFSVRCVQLNIEMIPVQGGTFTMGCTTEQGSDCDSNESPSHSVTLSGFSIGKYPVTQAQWKAVMGSSNNPSNFKGDNLPVEMVSWNDVQTFISTLNSLTGKTYRLPTEAEWEYAARGGASSKGYKYAGSNTIGDVAWFADNNSPYGTKPVGTKASNELGIYDMNGNVYEWVSDWYGATYYSSSPQTNPTGPSSGSSRVIRSGGWGNDARYCRVSYRRSSTPDFRGSNLGFRLALSPP